MKLEQLLEGVPFTLVQGSLDTEVQDIIYDSRKAAPGLAFVCIVGTQRDSHEFAADCAAVLYSIAFSFVAVVPAGPCGPVAPVSP